MMTQIPSAYEQVNIASLL